MRDLNHLLSFLNRMQMFGHGTQEVKIQLPNGQLVPVQRVYTREDGSTVIQAEHKE